MATQNSTSSDWSTAQTRLLDWQGQCVPYYSSSLSGEGSMATHNITSSNCSIAQTRHLTGRGSVSQSCLE